MADNQEDRSFEKQDQGAPNAKPRERGSRADEPSADTTNPGREFGAAGGKEDGPDETAGTGTGGG